jgi:hypothetical protein
LNLGRMGPEARAAVPDLLAALGDPDQFVRLGAVRALASISPRDDAVIAALSSKTRPRWCAGGRSILWVRSARRHGRLCLASARG